MDRMYGGTFVRPENKKGRFWCRTVDNFWSSDHQYPFEKSGGTTKTFCGNPGADSTDPQTYRLFFSIRAYHGIFCLCSGHGADASQKDRNPGSGSGGFGCFFPVISGGTLSYGCTGRISGSSGGKYTGCMDREKENGKKRLNALNK